ncbi:MAG: UDP-N-acetylmuramoyl-tripeptide--D-alanyl-D-alanine ligase [Pontixanthobacter sp.]
MNALKSLRAWPADKSNARRMALWTAQEVATATRGTASGEFQMSGVEIDSRDVRSGDLFFALKGEATDGHNYLEKAFANGATAAVVDRLVDYPHILVADTNAALEALAAYSRDRSSATRIGVTGSVGKTGVKEAIFAALDRSGRGSTHRSVRSYNNHVGVPLSLARMPSRSHYGIFEMGMNHAGEISALTAQVKPHVAVITTIAPAHIENLGSIEAIAAAKAEIFEAVMPGGTAVIPADIPQFVQLRDAALSKGIRVVSFGKNADADVRLLDSIPAANGGSLVTADMGDARMCFTVAEPGEHWVSNALAVMAAVRAAGGDLGSAGLALAEMGGLKGRGARHQIAAISGKALMIDESYNANPASMRATLRQLGQTPATRRIAVLGSMKELGDFAPRFHAQLAEPLADAQVDYAILVGEEMGALARDLGKGAAGALAAGLSFAHCEGPAQAISALEEFGVTSGDAILVKGSNSVGLGRLVAHFTARN